MRSQGLNVQASRAAARADRNLQRLFGYYSEPDRRLGRKAWRRLRYWHSIRDRAESKLWRAFD